MAEQNPNLCNESESNSRKTSHSCLRYTIPNDVSNCSESGRQDQNYYYQESISGTNYLYPVNFANSYYQYGVSPIPNIHFQNFHSMYGSYTNNFQPQLSPPYVHRPFPEWTRQLHGHPSSAGDFNLNGLRTWQRIADPHKTGFNFSVMSYNVLAQDLLEQHSYLYMYHDPKFLNWNTRWNNFLKEIRQFKPDILCLQEVQKSHLTLYMNTLKQLGYTGLYKKRTGPRTDGCAIFFKYATLNMVDYISVEYKQPNIRILDRDNVALIAKFTPRTSNKEFVIATTHLLYNPKREDVRLGQIQLLLTEIDRLAFVSKDKYVPVIITGDLNSTPDSAILKFILNGKLKYQDLTERALKSGERGPRTGKKFLPSFLQITDNCQHAALVEKREDDTCMPELEQLKLIKLRHSERKCDHTNMETRKIDETLFGSGTLKHQFRLKSVYEHYHDGEDVIGTTHQDEWLPVDYIFYSSPEQKRKKLTLLSRFRLATRSELGELRIPNRVFSSDHFALIAKFQLTM